VYCSILSIIGTHTHTHTHIYIYIYIYIIGGVKNQQIEIGDVNAVNLEFGRGCGRENARLAAAVCQSVGRVDVSLLVSSLLPVCNGCRLGQNINIEVCSGS